ncbi:hypothetical protein BDA99DRAFT_531966 [Phascolomyces articulosus]|uniref:Uncharacterized protein n=1 Tax=Phascolomyces articulosus TaxID=60185 RepID=A0AAD5PL79_9FUNG|nr:hypothetical protein BDA99DRAFT_531966 [Phascolomyces articulosus]
MPKAYPFLLSVDYYSGPQYSVMYDDYTIGPCILENNDNITRYQQQQQIDENHHISDDGDEDESLDAVEQIVAHQNTLKFLLHRTKDENTITCNLSLGAFSEFLWMLRRHNMLEKLILEKAEAFNIEASIPFLRSSITLVDVKIINCDKKLWDKSEPWIEDLESSSRFNMEATASRKILISRCIK